MKKTWKITAIIVGICSTVLAAYFGYYLFCRHQKED